MDYQYLTPELQQDALAERRRQLEVSYFQTSVSLALAATADAAGLTQQLSDLDAQAATLDSLTPDTLVQTADAAVAAQPA